MKKVPLVILAVIFAITCYAQTSWIQTYSFDDLELNYLLGNFSPSLKPLATYKTDDGIITVLDGYIYEQITDVWMESAYFTYALKTDFDGNIYGHRVMRL